MPAAAGLEAYAGELLRWNRAIRLVGPHDASGIRTQIADALAPFLFFPPPFPLLDIGTGAGLPAIPIALVFPGAEITCIEPLAKRVSFLRHILRSLRLPGIRVVHGRAEAALVQHPELAESFRSVTARALAAPKPLLQLARSFLVPGGLALLPRGPERASPQPGWELLADREHPSPAETGSRRLHVYRAAP
jgi:16S rRNA (guanine527-N7)-methyltransferase